jgi:hypothetical protein
MKFYTSLVFTLFSFCCKAQELYPLTEPASSIPKGVLGVRLMSQTYKATATDSAGQRQSINRNMFAARIMYGVTSNLSVEITAAGSNHHDTLLPPNLIKHTHNNITGAPIGTISSIPLAAVYPYLFAGFNFYAKYRIYSHDGEKSHFRLALFGDYSTVNVAHDEAEPELIDDCGGYEGGFIVTKLFDRWAVSLTSDYIHPTPFTEVQTKYIWPHQTTIVTYGDAIEYNLSIGYRFFPERYSSDYSQNNFNVYLEFLGKSYQAANVTLNGETLLIQTDLLRQGYYVEAHPGIQWIINSNARVDLSVGYPILGESYIHFYPVYTLGIQKYFYFVKNKKKPYTPAPKLNNQVE